MKTLLLLTLSLAFLFSCGKTNSVNSETVGGTATIETTALNSLDGNYDLIDSRQLDCSANIQITKFCDGFRINTNRGTKDEFCNINRGEMNSRINSMNGNVFKSEVVFHKSPGTIGANDDRRNSFTEKYTLRADGKLIRSSDHPMKGSGECLYQKR